MFRVTPQPFDRIQATGFQGAFVLGGEGPGPGVGKRAIATVVHASGNARMEIPFSLPDFTALLKLFPHLQAHEKYSTSHIGGAF